MKMSQSTALLIALTALMAGPASAQMPDSTTRRQQRMLDSMSAAIRALQLQIDSLRALPPGASVQGVPPAQQGRPAGAFMNVSFVGLSDFGWSTEKDVASLQLGDHDPLGRGFSIPNAELALDGAVDPYFRGAAYIVYKLDAEGESRVELEEMFILTSSLPANLQLKVGQFLTEFGRHNPQHPHSWAFADQPLVINRMFGPDGLRGQGARLAWLLPTPWYTEAMLTVQNSFGETAFSFRSPESEEIHGGVITERTVDALDDLLYVPRLTASVELTSNQTLLAGVSGGFGPNNAGSDTRTQIYGADVYWKWKSPSANKGFPFVSFQSEVMTRSYEVDERISFEEPLVTLPRETLRDSGLYAQLLWGIKPLIVLGLRGEFVDSRSAAFEADLRADRYRVSPNLTWYPTEFSKFRIQYNYDHREAIGSDHSLWFQLEFLLGAHAAHKF